MRFTTVTAKPYTDGRRVRLGFKLTPFLERPCVDIAVTNAAGDEVAALSLIEAMDTEFEFTLHLRGPEPQGEHTAHLTMFYTAGDDAASEHQIVDERNFNFFIAPST
jgi:hypothetical protein